MIAHLDPQRYWPKLCRALGIEDLEKDPRFNTIEARAAHARELVAIFDERFATKTREEWMKILEDEDCIFTPIQTLLEVTQDVQAIANRYFIEIDHPTQGKMKMVGFPWDFSETPASWRREAPGFGQHTDEILREIGYAPEEIAQLRTESVIQ